ncbi:terminase large subunit domain-containing protein [Rhodococcoides kroppenstedtii]|nr:terminase family protein [Rhodococcus kroppenstedtii]
MGLDYWQATAVSSTAYLAGVSTPRQQGKTEAAVARAIFDAAVEGRHVHYSVASQALASNTFRRAREQLQRNELLDDSIIRTTSALGRTRIEFRNGGRLTFGTRFGAQRATEVDLLIVDEASMFDASAYAAATVATATRQSAQILALGTAPYPDENSRRAAAGFARMRHLALRGTDATSWCEWSAAQFVVTDEDGPRLAAGADRDEAVAAANPAVPDRIRPEMIERERQFLPDNVFLVERLNIGDWRLLDDVEPAR